MTPDACTLPVADRPVRQAEFVNLFATALRAQERPAPTRLRWALDPAFEAAARDLTAREAACCAFFEFTFTPAESVLWLDVEVPTGYVEVLTGLESLAAQGMSR